MKSYDGLLAEACAKFKSPLEVLKSKEAREKDERLQENKLIMAQALGLSVEELPGLCGHHEKGEIKNGEIKMHACVGYPDHMLKNRTLTGPILGSLYTINIAVIYCPKGCRLSSWSYELDAMNKRTYVMFSYWSPLELI